MSDVILHPEEVATFSAWLLWVDYYHTARSWVYLANLLEENPVWYSVLETYTQRIEEGNYEPLESEFFWNKTVYPAYRLQEFYSICELLYAGMAVGRDWGRADEWKRQVRIATGDFR